MAAAPNLASAFYLSQGNVEPASVVVDVHIPSADALVEIAYGPAVSCEWSNSSLAAAMAPVGFAEPTR